MVKTPIFIAADSRPGQNRNSGFTLIESVVALLVVALILAVVPPLLSRGSPESQIKSAAREVAAALRTRREQAIFGSAETVLYFHPTERRFGTAPDAQGHDLADRLAVEVTGAKSEIVEEDIVGIRFFPDGSSTGGTVKLALESRELAVAVDWLTGRVRIRDETR